MIQLLKFLKVKNTDALFIRSLCNTKEYFLTYLLRPIVHRLEADHWNHRNQLTLRATSVCKPSACKNVQLGFSIHQNFNPSFGISMALEVVLEGVVMEQGQNYEQNGGIQSLNVGTSEPRCNNC